MAIEYENLNGRLTFFGPQDTTHRFGSHIANDNGVCRLEFEVSWDQLPVDFGADDVGNGMFLSIPGHSAIRYVDVHILEEFDAGITLDVGSNDTDGTNPLPTDFAAAVPLDVKTWVAGAGALVGAATPSNPIVVTMATSAVPTVGRVKVVIHYVYSQINRMPVHEDSVV